MLLTEEIIFNYEKNKTYIYKQKNKDSNRWLDRHLNDEYVIKSQRLTVFDQDLHIN